MLLSGQQKHQLEVGLSLPNSIPDPSQNWRLQDKFFGTSDPDEGARADALIEQAITLIESCGPRLQRLACKWGSVADGE